jgi:hypothetical protein
MLEDDSSLNHFLGGLLLGAVVVGLIFRIIRRSTREQDPALDPVVESTDPTLPDSESSSDNRLRIQATQRLPRPENPQSVWQLLIQGYESQIPVPLTY